MKIVLGRPLAAPGPKSVSPQGETKTKTVFFFVLVFRAPNRRRPEDQEKRKKNYKNVCFLTKALRGWGEEGEGNVTEKMNKPPVH